MGAPRFFSQVRFFSRTAPLVAQAIRAESEPLIVDRALSRKIDGLRCLMILFVVWMHADNLVINIGQPVAGSSYGSINHPAGWPADAQVSPAFSQPLWFTERMISRGLGSMAVPLLFLMSGLLLFNNYQLTWSDYRRKVFSRARTLLVPYVLWSGLALASFFILQNTPGTSAIFGHRYLDPFSWKEFGRLLLIDQIPSQLWYIRSLCLYILLSPAIMFSVRMFGPLLPILAAAVWLGGFNNAYFEVRGLVFIPLAAYLHTRADLVKQIEQIPVRLTAPLWVLFSALKIQIEYASLSTNTDSTVWAASVIFGMITVWNSYPFYSNWIESKAAKFLPYSFFVYMFHEPLQGGLIKAGIKILGPSTGSHLLFFFTTPIVVLFCGYFVARILSKTLPALYSAMSGGRASKIEARVEHSHPAIGPKEELMTDLRIKPLRPVQSSPGSLIPTKHYLHSRPPRQRILPKQSPDESLGPKAVH